MIFWKFSRIGCFYPLFSHFLKKVKLVNNQHLWWHKFILLVIISPNLLYPFTSKYVQIDTSPFNLVEFVDWKIIMTLSSERRHFLSLDKCHWKHAPSVDNTFLPEKFWYYPRWIYRPPKYERSWLLASIWRRFSKAKLTRFWYIWT